MRVFVSSVRHGLEEERDALPALITAVGHTPIRFEDFSAQTTPSRQACLDGLATADVYLLILGPKYGHRFSDTGQSPTHDEWAAATAAGMQRLVYRKQGVRFDDDQQALSRSIGDYASGVFYDTFTTTTGLLTKVVAKLRELEHAPSPLSFSPLAGPVAVTWRSDFDEHALRHAVSSPELEVHVLPIGATPRSARVMADLAQSLATQLRIGNVVDHSQPLNINNAGDAVILTMPAHHVGWNEVREPQLLGIRAAADGQASAWASLPGDRMGSILDADALPEQIAGLLRQLGQLRLVETPNIAIGIGINSTMSLSTGRVSQQPRSQATMLSLSERPIHAPPDEQVGLSALDAGALEVARPLARRLLHAVSAHRWTASRDPPTTSLRRHPHRLDRHRGTDASPELKAGMSSAVRPGRPLDAPPGSWARRTSPPAVGQQPSLQSISPGLSRKRMLGRCAS